MYSLITRLRFSQPASAKYARNMTQTIRYMNGDELVKRMKDLNKGKQEDLKEGKQEDQKEGKQEDAKEGKQEDLKEGKQEDLKEGKQEDLKEGKQEDLKEGKQEDAKERKQDFVVVDVRDYDFVGGNIKGAINQPSVGFEENVADFVLQTKEVPLVIFHCMLSQARGPKAARMYAETRRFILEDNDIDHEVAILRDGFADFQAKYRKDPELIENWDKDCWEE